MLIKTSSMAIAIAVLATVGCESSPAKGTPDAIENAWKSAGLSVSELTDIEAGDLGKATCRHGLVSGLDVTLCRYETPAEAKAAERAGLDTIGKTTGAALAEDYFLLVVADRHDVDVHGKTLNKVARSFQKAAVRGGDDDSAGGGDEIDPDELPSWAKGSVGSGEEG